MRTKWLFWLIPAALAALSMGLYLNILTNFLGLICLCLAFAVAAALGIWMLSCRHRMLAKALGTVLGTVVGLAALVFLLTGIMLGVSAVGGAGECDYVLVLGAKVYGDQPGPILTERIDAAWDYLVSHPDVVAVLSGGQGEDEGISEAQCMYNQLTARGIPPERLLLEEKSTSTWENLEFSLALLLEKTGEKSERIGIITSEFHLYRAELFAREQGLEPVGIPAKSRNFIVFGNYFLREIAGVWHYIILGG